MRLSSATLARVRGTAAVVAISALTGCGGASTASNTPPPVVDPPVTQVAARTDPPATSTDNANTSVSVPSDEIYAVECGRG